MPAFSFYTCSTVCVVRMVQPGIEHVEQAKEPISTTLINMINMVLFRGNQYHALLVNIYITVQLQTLHSHMSSFALGVDFQS